ncbi:hypothetical protein F8388_019972 [Cannabis sativa]|uniref:AB hydrolase-1 domain-containing protein n=1 Tax=Cannabis sativa TaxID=3483 RepID=A0A7J6GTW1_CANSA|nr:hypothetical protein F8388_019972 [Cannabis sativa]
MLFGPALHSDIRSVAALAFGNREVSNPGFLPDPTPCPGSRTRRWSLRVRASSIGAAVDKSKDNRFSICTADELHFVKPPNSDWSLALWRFLPSPEVVAKNHPLLLLSGIATNAIGYDLSPQNSLARCMSKNGYDTWILEVRGSGLSTLGLVDLHKDNDSLNSVSENITSSSFSYGQNGGFADSDIYSARRSWTYMVSDQLQLMAKLRKTAMPSSGRSSNFVNKGLLEAHQNSVNATGVTGMKQWLVDIMRQSQRLFPEQFMDLQENISATLEDLQQQFELMFKYDWDFDNFLEEDVPAAMEYIRAHCKPKDGKLHAIGHSMGGILLYAMISRCCSEEKDCKLASVTTLASSLDYTSSRSSLKLLLPLADPAQALNVPAIPVGAIISAIHPLTSYPPYLLSWLKSQISAQEMMRQELYEKLVLNNFCTIPAKLLLQLTSAFQKGGLRDRSGTFFYKDHLHKTNVPILAIGGDQDLICPPEAVYETAKLIPEHMLTFKIVGEPEGPHYAHYDVVGSHLAANQVYPHIIEFLNDHDMT